MFRKKIINLFLLLLPIVDLITALSTRLFPLPLSIGIVIKGVFLIYLIIYLIFYNFSKYKKISLIYISIIFIYELLYFIFKIPTLNIYSFILELIGQFKFLFYPITLISFLCIYEQYNFNKKEIFKILIINIFTYILLMILPLITNTGFDTYTYNTSLKGSVGWFYSANELSNILVLLFPFIYFLNYKINNYIYYFINLILLIIISFIGTKTSFIGIILVSFILFIIVFIKYFRNGEKIKIFNSLLIFILALTILSNNNIFTNYNTINKYQDQQEQEIIKNILSEEKEIEINKKYKNNKIYEFFEKYGKVLLSDRDVYLKKTIYDYSKEYNYKTFLTGLGLTKNGEYVKLIEIDIFDLYYYYGVLALIINIIPVIFLLYLFFKTKKNFNMFINILVIGLGYAIASICGHILMAPAVSIYLIIHFILFYNECNLLSHKKHIEKNKVTIYALHLNYGGIEKNISMLANILSEKYKVEIISMYKLDKKPFFNINNKVNIKYLTNDIKPNKEEFKKAIQSKNIIRILKEGLYAIKVLYLKHTLITNSMKNCNSEIIISTRIDFTEKLIKNNEYNNIKIAQEHIYHNNNNKYLNKLYKTLKRIDYLMPSSNYLTNYYKELYPNYSNKIITNEMPIETDNKISKLNNKTIISVGRLESVKAFDDLIKVFSKIDDKEYILNIVGTGSEYEKLNNLIKELNLTNRVNLLGHKTIEELNELYFKSDLYIMTSIEESFGLVLLEAASHGLPIIAYSSALGAKEILKDNNGILIDNRNEREMIYNINNVLKNNALLKEYQKKSIKISKYYNYDNIKTNILNFYNNIEKTNIYNSLYKKTKKDCYKLIERKLKNKEKTLIITANPETYMLSEKDMNVNDMLYDNNNLIVPDGIAIVKTANYLGYNIKERITGVDLAEHLLELANKNKYKVYLFGASEKVMEKLENIIEVKYPNIKLVGSTNGYVKDKDSVMEYIKTTKPDIVMLALGIPLQEKLIYKHFNDFKKGVFIGVGGSFDVLSGRKKRAPKIFIKLNLEWFYRIICEPKRISRFIKHNVRFLIKIIKEKKNN